MTNVDPNSPDEEVDPTSANANPSAELATNGQGGPGRIIKRYSNRKLYDTVTSKYVTLEEIAQLIKEGEEVRVIDNKTKDDLTAITLTQIIYEEEKQKARMPLGMLRQLISSSGEAIQEFFERSVKAPVAEMRDHAKSGVEEIKHGAMQLREAATRSLTDTARRVFSRSDADIEKKVDELLSEFEAAVDDLKKKIAAHPEQGDENLLARLSERLEQGRTKIRELIDGLRNVTPRAPGGG